MARVILTPDDEARIAAAVAAAERGTSGEIRCVLADDRDPLRAALTAGWAALILPALALLFGFRPEAMFDLLRGWQAAHGTSPEGLAASALHAYVTVQAVVLIVSMGIAISPIPRWLTPQSVRKARVDRAAAAQFDALGLADTEARTGVLLFVSLAWRRAEVLADQGIYERTPHQSWDEVIGLLTAPLSRGEAADGFVAAVTRVGEILATYLPPQKDDRNELPDGPVTVR